jgi:hypothetical protein
VCLPSSLLLSCMCFSSLVDSALALVDPLSTSCLASYHTTSVLAKLILGDTIHLAAATLARLGRGAHKNNDSRRNRHHHHRFCQSVCSEAMTSGSTATRTVMLAQAMSLSPTWAQRAARVQILSSPSLSTVFTRSARRPERSADIVHDGINDDH